MKKKIIQILLILSFSVNFSLGFAQDNRSIETKVADILAQLPSSDSVQYARLMDGLASLGTEGFAEMVKMLKKPGEGQDAQVRYAISGLSRYFGSGELEHGRGLVEDNLLKSIETVQDKEVKTFLIHQLHQAGSQKSYNVLQKYLTDERLSEPAAQALSSIRAEGAEEILIRALDTAEGGIAITIINALGELQSEKAAPKIIPFVESNQLNLKKVALYALSKGGSPVAYSTLFDAAGRTGFGYEASGATAAFIAYAGKLGEKGHLKLCEKACKTIMKANKEPGKLHNCAAALEIYARHFRPEAMPLLLKAVENDDKAFRFSALNLVEKMEGEAVTREWVLKASKSRPEVKAEIIGMLGRRGDLFSWGFILESLESNSGEVREASVKALAQLSGDNASPILLRHLLKGKDTEVTRETLLTLVNSKALSPVAEGLRQTRGATKAALVDIIAARSGAVYFDEVFRITASKDMLEREAAFRALKNISSAENLDELLALLLSTSEQKEIEAVQEAVVAAVSKVEEEGQKAAKLLQALQNTSKKARIIKILPEVGGEAALEAVTAFLNDPSRQVKEAAFNALVEWPDYTASHYLLDVCKNQEGEYRSKALEGFISQVQKADIPDDQKLLQLRKVMPFASCTEEKLMIIEAVGGLKTFLSLAYAGKYLDDKELQQGAARAVMAIAVPGRNNEKGFTGEIARGLLQKVLDILSGEGSEYDKVRIKNYLEKIVDGAGFMSMFNGENLDGWKGFVANPIERMKMSKEELSKKQAEADNNMHEKWGVKDGTIAFTGEGFEGNNLVYHREYGNYEMIVDWRITKFGDSGIYLRGSPQVQIWDATRFTEGSGGLFNNKIHPGKPLVCTDNPIGEWNTFRITMIGEKVTVYLNGVLVVDNVILENYWDRDSPIFPVETIELQAHGSDLRFRDLYIREIENGANELTEEEQEEGFSALFNGNDLDNWLGDKASYKVEDGIIAVHPQHSKVGNLYTEKEYADFIFRFEFLLTPAANNGLGIRTRMDDDGGYTGTEIQILDNTAPVFANLKPYQYHGSVYGLIPAKRGFLKPLGEWNSQEVMVKGDSIKVTLNGQVIVDGNLQAAIKNRAPDGRSHPELSFQKGHIAFLGHDSGLKLRHIRIKELIQ